ncbi:MAG TPA: hypothetical protein DCM86_02805 [Verrucomicrobiales bacterium]|nr:hypothetical protein [Verrucomicrobiales bacterium]
MGHTRIQTIQYLRARPGLPWRWAENGSVLAWADGSTVAFREEVVQVLAALGPHGIPPFGAIVILLAACRGHLPTAADLLGEADLNPDARVTGPKGAMLSGAREQRVAQLEEALRQLARLADLPEELRRSVRSKCLLAEAVFEGQRPERHGTPGSLRQLAAASLQDEELNSQEPDGMGNSLLRHVEMVAAGLRPHSRETLELRLRTGLDSIPRPTRVEIPPAQRARALLEELLADPEHRPLGAAARELMAAVRLPRTLSRQEDLAIGGLSGLGNRGPLDRLLLSELAHDDLTLTLRIALNEALYLRHEPPEYEPPGSLALLLDSGLRLWGIPRVFATAAALAIVAADPRSPSVKAWRAHGTGLSPVDLLDRTSLTHHLGELEVDVHPGEALEALCEALAEEGTADTQSILVTHPDVLADPDFRRHLGGMHPGLGLIATVDREGRFALHAPPFSPRQPLAESRLDLETIFASPRGAAELRRPASDPNLPALMQMDRSPILLPIEGPVDCWTADGPGRFLATLEDRRLVSFGPPVQGGEVVHPLLPGGRTLWLERVQGLIHLVQGSTPGAPAHLVSIPPKGAPAVIELCAGDPELSAYRSGDAVLVVRDRDVQAYSLSEGRLLDRAVSPHRWHRGRFFSTAHVFHFAHWTGQGIRFDPVPLVGEAAASPVVAVFDRLGMDGPWVLNQRCQALSLATHERIQIPLPIGQAAHARNVQLSRDGHRVYVSIPDLGWHSLFDLSSGKAEILARASEDLSRLEEGAMPVLPRHGTIWKGVDALAMLPGYPLALRHPQSGWRRIAAASGTCPELRLLPMESPPAAEAVRTFQPQPRDLFAHLGCSVDLIQWPSGSRAFLDNRGILHLKSHDPALPELSLVLDLDGIAGWCSDGVRCGPAFYHPTPPVEEGARILGRIAEFVQIA